MDYRYLQVLCFQSTKLLLDGVEMMLTNADSLVDEGGDGEIRRGHCVKGAPLIMCGR